MIRHSHAITIGTKVHVGQIDSLEVMEYYKVTLYYRFDGDYDYLQLFSQ